MDTKVLKKAPILKYTMPIPKTNRWVCGMPQSLYAYINSQTVKSPAQRAIIQILLTTMDYDKAKKTDKIPFRVTEGWICDLTRQEPCNYRKARQKLEDRGWLELVKRGNNQSNVLLVRTNVLWKEMLIWMDENGWDEDPALHEDLMNLVVDTKAWVI